MSISPLTMLECAVAVSKESLALYCLFLSEMISISADKIISILHCWIDHVLNNLLVQFMSSILTFLWQSHRESPPDTAIFLQLLLALSRFVSFVLCLCLRKKWHIPSGVCGEENRAQNVWILGLESTNVLNRPTLNPLYKMTLIFYILPVLLLRGTRSYCRLLIQYFLVN